MKNPFNYSVSLRVTHPKLTASEICAGFGKEAEFYWEAGEPFQRGTPGFHLESYCSFDILVDGVDGELAMCLDYAVSVLETRREFLLYLSSTGGSAQFYCFWYPDGDTGDILEPELMEKLARLKIGLAINVLDLNGIVTS